MHETKVAEVHDRFGTHYNVVCSCGWNKIGFEYRVAAGRVARDHLTVNTAKEAR